VKQKFRKLSFIRVCNEFDCDFDAIVEGTYSQMYSGCDIQSYSIYKIEDGEIVDNCSWYDENELTLLPNQDRDKAKKMIKEYKLKKRSYIGKERILSWHDFLKTYNRENNCTKKNNKEITMEKGKLEYAVRKAQESFDCWNDVTGVIQKFSGYYYEALGEIETAVRIGARVTLGLKVQFDKDGQLIDDEGKEV
jgi:hypothetical protein